MNMAKIMNKSDVYKNQNYSDIKSHCLQEGSLFTDVTFPADDSVIGTGSIPANIIWKRASELVAHPKLFNELETVKIVKAGELSCNWMVSACAILADVNEVRNKVIPDYWHQEWGEKNYCGVFHFKFWRFGTWTDVVIDDYLPTVDNKLLTTQSIIENEFWPSLIEKAYAKLHGSYEALREGELADALVDFTGGVCEQIDLTAGRYSEMEEKRVQLYEILNKEMSDHSIICFTITAPSASNIGENTELGLLKGHTYHMTDIKKVYLGETSHRSLFHGREKVAMVRLKDPRQEEEKAPNSPDSALSSEGNPFTSGKEERLKSKNSDWQSIGSAERKRLGLVFRDSHEFWIPLEDVVDEFNEVTICRLVSENFFAAPGKKWRGVSFSGVWESGTKNEDRSGGGDLNGEKFLFNPQYVLNVDRNTEMMIQLLQFQNEDPTPTEILTNQLIGFHIIKVENNRETRLHKLWPHNPVIVTENHRRKREIFYRGQLAESKYVIIPTTYREGDSSSFLLRVFSHDGTVSLNELKEDIPKNWFLCSCLLPEVELVTVVIIERAELESKHHFWGNSRLNPYCSITCEGDKVKTDIARDDLHPEWHDSFIFYRKKPKKPLILKVFSQNTIFPNALLGECELPADVTHSPTQLDATVYIKDKKTEETISNGTVHLTILTEDNLNAV